MSEVSKEQIVAVMQDVAQNAANISIIKNHLEDQRNDTKKILMYLENDPTTGRVGLFAQQQDHERRIEQIEDERRDQKVTIKAWVGVATVLGGVVMTVATYIVKLFFGK